jgi:hypothetical protein
VEAVVLPAQPGAALIVYTRLVVDVLRVVELGAVRTRPLPTETFPTASVLLPVRAVNGVIVMVAAEPTPFVVPQVTAPATTAFSWKLEVTVSVTLTLPELTEPMGALPAPLNVTCVTTAPLPPPQPLVDATV